MTQFTDSTANWYVAALWQRDADRAWQAYLDGQEWPPHTYRIKEPA